MKNLVKFVLVVVVVIASVNANAQKSCSSVVVMTNNPTACGANNGTATVSGGVAGVTYTWNTTPVQTKATAIGLRAGVYTTHVTSPSCDTIISVVLVDPAAPIVNPVASNDVVSKDEEVIFTASGGSASYTFYVNEKEVQKGTSNVYKSKVEGKGTVAVVTKGTNDCMVSSRPITVIVK